MPAPRIEVTLLAASAAVIAATVAMLARPSAGDAGGNAALGWKLVYERYDAKRGEGGTGLELLTASHTRRPTVIAREATTSDSYSWPEWSPDGNTIAFHGHLGGKRGVYAVRVDGQQLVRVTSADSIDFEWSPDGRSIAFVADCEPYSPSDGFRGCAAGRIEVASSKGGQTRVVARLTGGRARSDIRLLAWSPDGERVLAWVQVRARERLVSIDVSSGAVLALADSHAGGRLGDASWSSDGNLIAYTRRCWENRIGDTFCDLAVMNDDGRSKRLVYPRASTSSAGPSQHAPVWIPGTTHLVVPIWGTSGHTRLLDASSGQSRIIAQSPWSGLAVSSDSSTVAHLARGIGEPDVVVLARPNGTVIARFPLRKQPTRNLSWGAPDHELWLP